MDGAIYIILTLFFLEGIDCIITETTLSIIMGCILIVSSIIIYFIYVFRKKTKLYWYFKSRSDNR